MQFFEKNQDLNRKTTVSIRLISHLSRVFEKLLYQRLINFCEKADCLQLHSSVFDREDHVLMQKRQ